MKVSSPVYRRESSLSEKQITKFANKRVSLCPELEDVSASNSSVSSGDENAERGNWSGRMDFLMSLISYAIGLGNIWRFPYLCYRNGGAVFLIPYIVFLLLCGMPMFFMEVSFGQFASLSPITIWRISPFFKGVGIGMVIISAIVCVYYNVIITWTMYFFLNSFYPTLPWSTCDNPWNTPMCTTQCVNNTGVHGGNLTSNLTALAEAFYENMTDAVNLTDPVTPPLRFRSPSEEYWEHHVLDISKGIDQPNGIRWPLFGCLVGSWVLVFFCLIKGVKSSGKVVYFTATFPYLVLLCLLVRALTLDGAIDGIKFYVIPKWEKLFSMQVWGEAAMQIFYSVGAAWGALITMASFNKFNNNCYRDALVVPVLNCCTSIFAGFVIFSILGFMAKETCSTIDNVINEGPGLVFVVYPQAIAKFPIPQLWAVLFFSMLLCVGMGSQFAMFQTVTSAFIDEVDYLKNKKVRFLLALCIFEFLLGIPCITRGGIYFLQVMDWYSSTFSLMILSLAELIAIAWIYGVDRFVLDIELMIGIKPSRWFTFAWRFITPALITFLLSFSFISHTPVTYGDKDGVYNYPSWAIGVGWIFALCSILPLPAVAIYQVYKQDGSLKERFLTTLRHNKLWGPSLDEHRKLYLDSLHKYGSSTEFVVASLHNILESKDEEDGLDDSKTDPYMAPDSHFKFIDDSPQKGEPQEPLHSTSLLKSGSAGDSTNL